MKIALFVHGHPEYSVGGGEMAAYSLYKGLSAQAQSDVHLISWIPRANAKLHGPGQITKLKRSSNEWLYTCEPTEWLYQSSASRAVLYNALVPLMKSIDPDVIHFHHFMGFGVDALRILRLEFPRAKILFTLHEFLAICLRDGQMIKVKDNRLCTSASTVACSGCFPQLNWSHFALREEWFKRHFELVDAFISPSSFLRSRYVDWGIPEEKIEVIENAQICTTQDSVAYTEFDGDLASTFAFFGQLTPYKGAEVLLRAAGLLRDMLARDGAHPIPRSPRVLVYGGVPTHNKELHQGLASALEESRGLVDYRGAYAPSEVVKLMSTTGWVVVPSIWWENSPVVIEEAFYAGRPVICSDIGGMKEKVVHERSGLHFRAGDPHDLARVMYRCMTEPALWDMLRAGVRRLPSLDESAASHRALYEKHRGPERNAAREAV